MVRVGTGGPGLQLPSETAEPWLGARGGEGSFPAGLPGRAFAEPEGAHIGFWPGIRYFLYIGYLYIVFVFIKMGLFHILLCNVLFLTIHHGYLQVTKQT